MVNFWIIPIIAFIGAGMLGTVTIYEKITVNVPLAEAELKELKGMTCEEIKTRNSAGSFHAPSVGKYARERVADCKEISDGIAEKERNILNKLLADPTSKEAMHKRMTELLLSGIEFSNQERELTKKLDMVNGNVTLIKTELTEKFTVWQNGDYGDFIPTEKLRDELSSGIGSWSGTADGMEQTKLTMELRDSELALVREIGENANHDPMCTQLAVFHLMKYSNIQEPYFDGDLKITQRGLPDGLSQNELDDCADLILSHHFNILDMESQLEENLQWLLGSCACKQTPGQVCTTAPYQWENSTHSIDNNICEWIEK